MLNPDSKTGTKGRLRSGGCLPCKARKKKCDERRPICVGCERNVLLCHWPPVARKQLTDLSTPDLRVVRNENCGNWRPVSKSGPGHLALSIDPIRNEVFCTFGSTVIKHPISQMLYQHWICQTANNISTLHGHANAFATELPKLAIRYPDTVLQALLALSGVHFCNKNKNTEVAELTWSHLAQALRALKYALTRHVSGVGDESFPLLLTTLILCFLETIRGDTQGHLNHHLKAAGPLLSSVLSSGLYNQETTTMEFVKEYYAYIACITNLTLAIDDIGTNDFGLPLDTSVLTRSKGPGVLLGCAHDLFDLIPRISSLIKTHWSRSSSLQNEGYAGDWATVHEYQALQMEVLKWNPDPGSDASLITCGRIYQQAILIYLEISISQQSTRSNETITQCIDIIMSLLEIVPEDAPILSTLCWPLALVGSITENHAYREIIDQRLERMWQVLGLCNINRTRDFLGRLWADQDIGIDIRDSCSRQSLERLMQRYGTQISFV